MIRHPDQAFRTDILFWKPTKNNMGCMHKYYNDRGVYCQLKNITE